MTDVDQPKMAGSGVSSPASRCCDAAAMDETDCGMGSLLRIGAGGTLSGGRDEVDALPESLRYCWFDLLCTLISIVTYVVDLVMDCIVAYYFYHLAVDHGIYHYWYFGLTTFFIIMPALTMTGFSFRWYLMDADNHHLPPVGTVRWALRLVALLCQVAPILRYLDSMRYGILSRVEKWREDREIDPTLIRKHRQERLKWYTMMVYEDADATLLRLYESFMESAPQLVLQIYILIKDPYANRINSTQLVDEGVDPYLKLIILVLSVASSLVSLAWSLVVYHRSLRYTYPNKKNISLLGTLFQFLWHFCSITARVLALSLFASVFPKWIGPLCVAHWMVMSSWVIFQRTAACNTPCEEFLFALVLGAIYIFSFFNAKEEQTRFKYLLYFSFSFIENSALLAVWFWQVEKAAWYIFPALVGHYLAFFGGIMFMLCYYIWFHPTGIEMPFFKFLKRSKGGAGVAAAAGGGVMGAGGDTTMTDGSATVPERMPLTFFKVDGGSYNLEELRPSASSPDLKQGTCCENAAHRGTRPSNRRSSSMPPQSSLEFVGVRNFKYMGQKSHDSQ